MENNESLRNSKLSCWKGPILRLEQKTSDHDDPNLSNRICDQNRHHKRDILTEISAERAAPHWRSFFQGGLICGAEEVAGSLRRTCEFTCKGFIGNPKAKVRVKSGGDSIVLLAWDKKRRIVQYMYLIKWLRSNICSNSFQLHLSILSNKKIGSSF